MGSSTNRVLAAAREQLGCGSCYPEQTERLLEPDIGRFDRRIAAGRTRNRLPTELPTRFDVRSELNRFRESETGSVSVVADFQFPVGLCQNLVAERPVGHCSFRQRDRSLAEPENLPTQVSGRKQTAPWRRPKLKPAFASAERPAGHSVGFFDSHWLTRSASIIETRFEKSVYIDAVSTRQKPREINHYPTSDNVSYVRLEPHVFSGFRESPNSRSEARPILPATLCQVNTDPTRAACHSGTRKHQERTPQALGLNGNGCRIAIVNNWAR